MKQSLRQKQKLSLNITNSLGKQIKLLSLSGFEISSQLNDLIDDYFELDDKNVAHFRDEHIVDRYRNILNANNDFTEILSVNNEADLQKKLDELEGGSGSKNLPGNVTNNTMFVGSTAELAKFLKKQKDK